MVVVHVKQTISMESFQKAKGLAVQTITNESAVNPMQFKWIYAKACYAQHMTIEDMYTILNENPNDTVRYDVAKRIKSFMKEK